MFENLNWWEIGALLMLALLIFGERLPKVIGDGLRMLRGLRAMAQNATTDLIALVRKYAPESVVAVEYRRGTKTQTASVTLAADAK